MTPTLQTVVISFLVLLVAFRLLDVLRPRERRLRLLRRGFWTDAAYWAFTSFVTRFITRISVIVAIVPVAWLLYGQIDSQRIAGGFGPLSRLPLAAQGAIILVLSDFVNYWAHRGFHTGRLWRFHAIHHSSRDLDWLSSVRVHPVNDVLMRVASTIPVLLTGVQPLAVAGLLPLLTLMAVLLHANVDWDWGPLRSVIASPRFHRWHHTDETEARDKNFAGLFPIWDILFGTYYMPRDRVPSSFGTNTPVPDGLLGQVLFPFRRER